jgi:hypothetical protein
LSFFESEVQREKISPCFINSVRILLPGSKQVERMPKELGYPKSGQKEITLFPEYSAEGDEHTEKGDQKRQMEEGHGSYLSVSSSVFP